MTDYSEVGTDRMHFILVMTPGQYAAVGEVPRFPSFYEKFLTLNQDPEEGVRCVAVHLQLFSGLCDS